MIWISLEGEKSWKMFSIDNVKIPEGENIYYFNTLLFENKMLNLKTIK